MPSLIERPNYLRAQRPIVVTSGLPRVPTCECGTVSVEHSEGLVFAASNPPWGEYWVSLYTSGEPEHLTRWDGGGVLWNLLLSEDAGTSEARFQTLRDKLSEIRKLQKGWDSYDAEPPSAKACDLAGSLLDLLQAFRLPAEYLLPTSDGSILLKHRVRAAEVTWEIDDDGEVGMMVERPGQEPEYHSPTRAEFGVMLSRLVLHG